jgi:predicted nucleic acid-binding protein
MYRLRGRPNTVVLVDTSVWLWRSSVNPLLGSVDEDPLAICPPILQELLQGAWDQRRIKHVRTIEESSIMLDSPVPIERFEIAGEIYRVARAQSFTVRSSNDCLIAAIAMHNDVLLLHADRDFDAIARFFPLRARNINPSASAARS